MRNMLLMSVAAAALILAGVGGWAASNTQARVALPIGAQIDTFQMAINAKNLPTQKYDDYSVVFN